MIFASKISKCYLKIELIVLVFRVSVRSRLTRTTTPLSDNLKNTFMALFGLLSPIFCVQRN